MGGPSGCGVAVGGRRSCHCFSPFLCSPTPGGPCSVCMPKLRRLPTSMPRHWPTAPAEPAVVSFKVSPAWRSQVQCWLVLPIQTMAWLFEGRGMPVLHTESENCREKRHQIFRFNMEEGRYLEIPPKVTPPKEPAANPNPSSRRSRKPILSPPPGLRRKDPGFIWVRGQAPNPAPIEPLCWATLGDARPQPTGDPGCLPTCPLWSVSEAAAAPSHRPPLRQPCGLACSPQRHLWRAEGLCRPLPDPSPPPLCLPGTFLRGCNSFWPLG